MKYLKKSFNKMEPYFSENIEDGIVLNANESPFNPPQKILDEYFNELKKVNFNRYPDMTNEDLCKSIAKRFNVSFEEVTCGVGSDELLEVTFKAVLEPNDIVLSFSPSFSMYEVFADLALAKFIPVSFNEDLTFNTDEMLTKIKEYNPKLVLICTPNNPTGQVISRNDIIRIVESTDALVLLDLAYIDFSYDDYTDIAKKYSNVIAFRTFSKAMSLPSIRCGYAISCKDNIDMINAVKAPYSLSIPSQILARIATDNFELYKDNIALLKSERDRVINELNSAGFNVYPSGANFIYLYLDSKINDDLVNNKIYIRHFKNGYSRITIGSPNENNELLRVVLKYAK